MPHARFATITVRCVGVCVLCAAPAIAAADDVDAPFRFFRRGQHESALPKEIPSDAKTVRRGFSWRAGRDWAWLLADLTIPAKINDRSTAGEPVGVRISCAEGGDVYVDRRLVVRYDNDHPALVLLAESAKPGQTVAVAIHAQTHLNKEENNTFGQAEWVLVEPARVRERAVFRVDPRRAGDPVPDGIVGLSQGGGVSDYDDATAAKLRAGGFRWFRMDNVFTGCVKQDGDKLTYDFADLDKRVDFLHKIGADAILAVSYMPQPLDAIPDPERHSAPRDYKRWEELCYRAAKRCLDRGRRVAFWEVWNEPNSGWLKPGPEDTGTKAFEKLYSEALGKPATDKGVVRMFEAYCKLYAATVRGVRRADPQAKIGGPALASGPFEQETRGHCVNGKGYARGLMLFCEQEKLPLDFVSWHEYFHPPEVFRAEARAFRDYLADFPRLQASVKSFMITEWNEAWWADGPQDNEVGAAWCANTLTRAILPERIDRPCFFYVKQGDMRFRGDYSLLMGENVPKPQYNVARMFNGLSGRWVQVMGDDGEVSCVAAWDAAKRRLAIILVNFTDRYGLRRHVRVAVDALPASLAGGRRRTFRIDATHSNVWHDRARAELEKTSDDPITPGPFQYDATLPPNSVTLVEWVVPAAAP